MRPLHNILVGIFFVLCFRIRFFLLTHNSLAMSSSEKQILNQNPRKSAEQSSYAEVSE